MCVSASHSLNLASIPLRRCPCCTGEPTKCGRALRRYMVLPIASASGSPRKRSSHAGARCARRDGVSSTAATKASAMILRAEDRVHQRNHTDRTKEQGTRTETESRTQQGTEGTKARRHEGNGTNCRADLVFSRVSAFVLCALFHLPFSLSPYCLIALCFRVRVPAASSALPAQRGTSASARSIPACSGGSLMNGSAALPIFGTSDRAVYMPGWRAEPATSTFSARSVSNARSNSSTWFGSRDCSPAWPGFVPTLPMIATSYACGRLRSPSASTSCIRACGRREVRVSVVPPSVTVRHRASPCQSGAAFPPGSHRFKCGHILGHRHRPACLSSASHHGVGFLVIAMRMTPSRDFRVPRQLEPLRSTSG